MPVIFVVTCRTVTPGYNGVMLDWCFQVFGNRGAFALVASKRSQTPSCLERKRENGLQLHRSDDPSPRKRSENPRRQRGSGFRWCAGLGPNDACGRDTLDGLVLRSTFALGLYTTEKGHRCQTRSGLLMRNCHSEFSYLAKLLPSFYFGVITSPRPADNW